MSIYVKLILVYLNIETYRKQIILITQRFMLELVKEVQRPSWHNL